MGEGRLVEGLCAVGVLDLIEADGRFEGGQAGRGLSGGLAGRKRQAGLFRGRGQ